MFCDLRMFNENVNYVACILKYALIYQAVLWNDIYASFKEKICIFLFIYMSDIPIYRVFENK